MVHKTSRRAYTYKELTSHLYFRERYAPLVSVYRRMISIIPREHTCTKADLEAHTHYAIFHEGYYIARARLRRTSRNTILQLKRLMKNKDVADCFTRWGRAMRLMVVPYWMRHWFAFWKLCRAKWHIYQLSTICPDVANRGCREDTLYVRKYEVLLPTFGAENVFTLSTHTTRCSTYATSLWPSLATLSRFAFHPLV